MRKLAAVEAARAIMTEGMDWGVWKWLTEKKRVRGIADEARAALDALEMKVKESWSNEYKIAYNQLVTQDDRPTRERKQPKDKRKEDPQNADPKALEAVVRVKDADDVAYNAHEDAEDVFAEAERKMSTSMAREAARMALVAYDRHEEAIRKAEALARTK
jgi:hypothetical protein